LLEAGIRVFEWKGSMLHAKTAVADGRWARVGSSNLNVASWIGNYELDAVIEHEPTAAAMEQMYLADLDDAREIVLQPRRRRYLDLISDSGRFVSTRDGARADRAEHVERATADDGERAERSGADVASRGESATRAESASRTDAGERDAGERRDPFRSHGGSASRAAAGALRIGRAVGAALTEQRVLAHTEARVVAIVGVVLVAFAAIAIIWPLVIAIPVAIIALWMSISLFIRAHALRAERRSRGLPPTRLSRADESQVDSRRSPPQ
jgi:cardiolipin synthase